MAYPHQKDNVTQAHSEEEGAGSWRHKAVQTNESSGPLSEGDRDEKSLPQVVRRDCVVRRRPKNKTNQSEAFFDRRVTCHDLGLGTYEGWLLKKSEHKSFTSRSWIKMFFKLKEFVLYYYKDKNAERATGVVCLAGYIVQYSNKRKWAMKISHKGMNKKLYVAAENKAEWEKWLQHLQLAAILYAKPDNVRNSKIFAERFDHAPTEVHHLSGYHSESDDDDDNWGVPREHIVETVVKLSALRRTIEAKRRALTEVDKLLAQKITSESLRRWHRDHPDLLDEVLRNEVKRDSTSSEEDRHNFKSGDSQFGATGTSREVSQQSGDRSNGDSSLNDKDFQGRKESKERTESDTMDTRL